jgi:hypothetical protein
MIELWGEMVRITDVVVIKCRHFLDLVHLFGMLAVDMLFHIVVAFERLVAVVYFAPVLCRVFPLCVVGIKVFEFTRERK